LRVALDSRPAADSRGVGRYSRCLLKALRGTAAETDEVLETNRPSATVRTQGTDVFHSPWMNGAMLHSPCPMVVTVHDVAELKRRSEHLHPSLRLRLRPLAVQRAAGVIVPSAAVAEDAFALLRLDRDRVAVIPEAADASMRPRPRAEIAALRARLGLPERYLLSVGGLEHPEPGTHVGRLAASARRLPLVMAGPTRPWAHELPDVLLTGELPDEQLAALYSGAHAVVISSERESFALAGVEALACGTPVVACDSPAVREALGTRAGFVAPGDVRSLVEQAERAKRPAPSPLPWSWEDAARATWSVYAQALARPDQPRLAPTSLRRRTLGAQ
jgi:glycosyltransferase involved in cell wall biosynthesis